MKHDDLEITNLSVSVEEKQILHGVSLRIRPGEVHAVMGPNGSGKSTLASALLGHPAYRVGGRSVIRIGTARLQDIAPEQRARHGLFLAFQSPIAIPGVSVGNLIRTAFQEIHSRPLADAETRQTENPVLSRRWKGSGVTPEEFLKRLKEAAAQLRIPETFLSRGIHDGFSGGEKKKIEMLQALVLEPKYAVFDEIDTGLDVDALRVVAAGMSVLRKRNTGILVITHYQRILQYLEPDFVHILVAGRIVKSGTAKLAKQIESAGYQQYAAGH